MCHSVLEPFSLWNNRALEIVSPGGVLSCAVDGRWLVAKDEQTNICMHVCMVFTAVACRLRALPQ